MSESLKSGREIFILSYNIVKLLLFRISIRVASVAMNLEHFSACKLTDNFLYEHFRLMSRRTDSKGRDRRSVLTCASEYKPFSKHDEITGSDLIL